MPKTVELRGLNGVNRDVSELAKPFQAFPMGRDHVIRIASSGMEIFMDGDATLFGPNYGLGNLLERKKTYGKLLLKPFQNFVKLIFSVVTHRKRQSVGEGDGLK